jgi:hypothetical protein
MVCVVWTDQTLLLGVNRVFFAATSHRDESVEPILVKYLFLFVQIVDPENHDF